MGKWKHTKEHITLKEGRALLLAVRRLSRAQKHRGHRHLILVDNMALCFAANKGRASNFGILRVLQQIGSVALASGLTIRTRWIPSEFNCADGPSRGQVCAGPFRQEDSKSVKVTSTYPGCSDIDNSGCKERRTHVGLSRGQEAVQGGFKSCGAGSRHDAYESSQNEEVDPCLESGEFCSSRRAGSEEPADGFGGEEHQCRGAESIRHVLREVSGLLQGQHDRLSGAGRKDRCSAGRLYGSSLSSGAKPPRGRENSSLRGVQQHRSEGKAHEVKKGFERLEEGNACSKQASSSQTDHVRHLHGAGGKRSFEHGTQGHHRFHPLFATWRRVGHSGTKRGGTCEVSRSSIQMDHSDNSRSRRASTRQGGSLRQFDSHRPEGGAVGRKRVVENEEKTAFTRRQDLRVHHGGFQGKVCPGRGESGDRESSPVSIETWRSDGRPDKQTEGPSSGQGQRKVDDGPECASLCKDRTCAGFVEQAQSSKSSILPVEREALASSHPGSEASEVSKQSVKLIDVFGLKHRPRYFALEIFAGTARVSQSLFQHGMQVFPIDICLFPSHNVLVGDVAKGIFNFIRQNRVTLIWLGMPCTTFSRARKKDGLGPGPLRDFNNLWGLQNLSKFDQRKLEQGNQLFLFTMKALELCEQYKVPYVLENPLTSFAWSMPPLVQFEQHHQSRFCDLDFCMFGEPWKKPTRLMYKFLDLKPLESRCQGHLNICSRSKRPHFPLKGRDAAGVFWTLRAQPYPWPLTDQFASLVASALGGKRNGGI